MVNQLIEAIKSYLNVINDLTDDESEAIERLISSLDHLAFIARNISFQFNDREYPEPPEIDYSEIRQAVQSRFPSLGFYNIAGNISDNVGDSEMHTGDSIDDISDIAKDMKDILWYFDNTSTDNALFYFDMGFKSHWGRQLRELQLYLHDRWY